MGHSKTHTINRPRLTVQSLSSAERRAENAEYCPEELQQKIEALQSQVPPSSPARRRWGRSLKNPGHLRHTHDLHLYCHAL